MRTISDALLAAQQIGSRSPYIKMLFTDKAGTTTKDFSTDSAEFGNRILNIDHNEEGYNGYATVTLNNRDSLIPSLKGYWTEIGYGLYVSATMGSDASNRTATLGASGTIIDLANPCSANGTITSVEVWANADLIGLRVGTFYTEDGITYTCRASATIGAVTAGSKQTFAVSIATVSGDVLGAYWSSGIIEASNSGGTNVLINDSANEQIDPGDSDTYSLYGTNRAISLKANLSATDYTGTQTSRLWVKHQRHDTSPGFLTAVLELEDSWTEAKQTEAIISGTTAPSFQKEYPTGDNETPYDLLGVFLALIDCTLDALGAADDGIIDTLIPVFYVNQQPYEYVAGLIYRALAGCGTKCFLRNQKTLAFKLVYPQAGDSVLATYYANTSPYFKWFVERKDAIVPNTIRVYNDSASYGEAVSQADIDAYKAVIKNVYISDLADADRAGYAAAFLLRLKQEREVGRALIPHDGRLELYDKLAFVDNRQASPVTYPSDSLTRIGGLHHIFVAGQTYDLEIILGGVSNTDASTQYDQQYVIPGKAETNFDIQAELEAFRKQEEAIYQFTHPPAPIGNSPLPQSPSVLNYSAATLAANVYSNPLIQDQLRSGGLRITQAQYQGLLESSQVQAALKKVGPLTGPQDLAKLQAALPSSHPLRRLNPNSTTSSNILKTLANMGRKKK